MTASALIEPADLAARLADGAPLKLIDATYEQGAESLFAADRIPGAVFFDIDRIADPDADMPHMLPAPGAFAQAVTQMGIGGGDTVIAYARSGIAMAACRAWWMFRVFGHDNIMVLNGGLAAWKAAGLKLDNTPFAPPPPARNAFPAQFRPELVKDRESVRRAVESGTAAIIDARSPARFSGELPEPHPGLRSGHIPESVNLFYADLLDPAGLRMKEPAALEAALTAAAGNKTEIITSCGSGVTACVLTLAYYNRGMKSVAVYDGSWTEWGRYD